MSDEKLLPCPFCGDEPELHWINEEGEVLTAWVSCKCGCEHHERLTKEVAVKKWNSRCIPNDTKGSLKGRMPAKSAMRTALGFMRSEAERNDKEARFVSGAGEAAEIYSDAAKCIAFAMSVLSPNPMVPWELDCQRESCTAPECECPPASSAGNDAQTSWHLMDTAPKDGTEILGWWRRSKTHAIIAWSNDGWWKDSADDNMVSAPTHWQYLQDGPSVSSADRVTP